MVDPEIIDVTPIEPEADVESFPAKLDAARREFWGEDAPEVEELPWE